MRDVVSRADDVRATPLGIAWLPSAAATAVAYYLTGTLGAALPSGAGVSAMWPAAGVALSSLLVFGAGVWPGIALGGFVQTISQHVSLPVTLWSVVGEVLAALAGVAMLQRAGFDRSLGRLRDVLALVVLGAVAGSLVDAAIGPTGFALGGYAIRRHWPFSWFVWWVGDAIGVLIAAPLLLCLRRGARLGIPRGRDWEAVAAVASTALVAGLLFRSSLPVVFLVFPFTVWAALRLGLGGAAVVNVVVAAIGMWATVHDRGPFAGLADNSRLVSLQFFNASVVVTSLVLAAVMDERRRALDDVRRSRARIVAAADVERRRLERDLHDGAQQRLLSLQWKLGAMLNRLEADGRSEWRAGLDEVLAEAQAAQSELRSLAHGIHPAVLTQQGLAAAFESLAEQCPVPTDTHAPDSRFPAVVEATAYFIASEALANMAKHAGATSARVRCDYRRGCLVVEVIDDGVGGAERGGAGLTGLADRAAALGGHLSVHSPPGGGTVLRAELPCESS